METFYSKYQVYLTDYNFLIILLFVHSLEKENEGLRNENHGIRDEILEMRAYINRLEADLQEKDNKLV